MKMWKSYRRLRNAAIEVWEEAEAYGSIDRLTLAKLHEAAYSEERVPVREEEAYKGLPDVGTPEYDALLASFTLAYNESVEAFRALLRRTTLKERKDGNIPE